MVQITPAMQASITDHVWEMKELLAWNEEAFA
jgi:hypothetical protein